jgi:hypothetical protein
MSEPVKAAAWVPQKYPLTVNRETKYGGLLPATTTANLTGRSRDPESITIVFGSSIFQSNAKIGQPYAYMR